MPPAPASILASSPIPSALYAAMAILAAGFLAACWAALHCRSRAAYYRASAALWRSKANARGRSLGTAWAKKCGPYYDREVQGRILEVLSGGKPPGKS